MESPPTVIGHEETQRMLLQSMQSSRRAHAYILYGPDSIGKKTLAQVILQSSAANPAEPLERNADFIHIAQEEDAQNISVDQIRLLHDRLVVRPVVPGGSHLVLIEDIDSATESAANALLKILEEPRADSLFFLTATYRSGVPSTIQSRCVMVPMHTLKTKTISSWLQQVHTLSSAEARQCATLAEGRPGLALAFASDATVRDARTTLDNVLLKLLSLNPAQRIAHIPTFFGGALEKESVQHTLDRLVGILRDVLLSKSGTLLSDHSPGQLTRTAAAQHSFGELRAMIDRARRAQKLSLTNVTPQLLLEYTLLSS